MPKIPPKKPVTIQQVITALLDDSNNFPQSYLHQFSDLEGSNLEALSLVWPTVPANRRASVFDDLEMLSEADTLVSFINVARMALTDSDPRVRKKAISLLWEDEDHRTAAPLIQIMETDPDSTVRAAAASGLGNFIYMGELEEIPAETLKTVEEALLSVMQSQEDVLVRRRALEALGFSSRKEVKRMLRSAYDSGERAWMVSAVYGMGRSADDAWEPQVMRAFRDPNPEVVYEAVRASGELELSAARRPLLRMLDDEMLDPELREAAVWALSKIGGEGVRDAIENMLDQTEDGEEIDFLESALDNLTFTEDIGSFQMFDFDDQVMLEDEGDDESGGENGGNRPKRPPASGHQ